MIKVWGRRSSSNVQALLWCLAELELDYERVDAGFIYGVVDTVQYRALNPNGTVPTLVDGEAPPMWETGAIIRYLANAYGSDPFWPSDPIARAQVDKWTEWSKINIALRFTAPVFWRVVRTAPSKRDPAAIAEGLAGVHQYLRVADARLAEHEFIAGPALTLADIQFGHCLFRYFDIDIERAPLTNVRRYYEALSTRSTYRDAVMVSYDELRVSD